MPAQEGDVCVALSTINQERMISKVIQNRGISLAQLHILQEKVKDGTATDAQKATIIEIMGLSEFASLELTDGA